MSHVRDRYTTRCSARSLYHAPLSTDRHIPIATTFITTPEESQDRREPISYRLPVYLLIASSQFGFGTEEFTLPHQSLIDSLPRLPQSGRRLIELPRRRRESSPIILLPRDRL